MNFWEAFQSDVLFLFRFIALDLILAVEDVFPLHQDKNNASFNVITNGRAYELMARDEEEKER